MSKVNRWTDKEERILRECYPKHGAKYCIPLLPGRTHGAIKLRARQLNIRYTGPKLGLFKPGQESYTKGKKMSAEVREKIKHTFFKKGHVPHNAKAKDGVISIRKDPTGVKYKWVRVSLGNWQLLHRVIWEKAYGPIPKGHIVRFKDGDRMNCQLNNLELISMRKNVILNANAKYPRQLQEEIYTYHELNNQLKSKNHAKK